MGKKQNKKAVPSKFKEPETSNTPTMQELDDCRKANRIFRNGNHKKALKIMEEARRNNENSGLLHRVHAGICTLAAFDNKDSRISKNHMDKAMELGQKAVLLSPNSIGFAEFYTRLLFQNSHYHRVVQEGQRALAILNPIDPATEEWMESDGNPDLQQPPEQRIAALRNSLQALVDLCEGIKKSTSGDGGDEHLEEFTNLTLLATTAEQTREGKLERVIEDQNGESKEIKQTKQSPEEQKKEIEERLLAAKLKQAIQENYELLQGKFARPQSESDIIAVLKEKEMTVKTRMMAERLKEEMRQQAEQQVDSQVNKDEKGKSPQSNPITLAEKRLTDARLQKEALQQAVQLGDSRLEQVKEKIHHLWNKMTHAEKQKLFKLNIDDLVAHFASTNTYLATEVIPDALNFVKDHQSWKFWMCWSCGKKFADPKMYNRHVLNEHTGSLASEQFSVLPSQISDDWKDNICNGKWEPLDALAAFVIPEAHSEQLPSIGSGNFTTQSKILDEKDNHTDKSSQKSTLKTKEGKVRPLEKESNVEAHSESSMEIAVDDIDLSEHEIKQLPKDDNSSTSSSLSEDNRALLIEGICQMLIKLLDEGCLVENHVDKILKYTMQSLQSLYPGSFLSGPDLSKTHLCICYLGVSQLKVIHTFLKELSEFTFERITAEENSTDEFNNHTKVPCDIQDRVELNGEFLCLVVEEQSLQGESTSDVHSDDAPSTIGLLNWIFSGKSYEDPLETWNQQKISRDGRVQALHQNLQKNYPNLQKYCNKKRKGLVYMDAIKDIWGLLLDELKERRSDTEYVPHGFEAILQKKQEELEKLEDGKDSFIRKCMLKTIQFIINQAGGSIITNEKTLTEIAAIIDCGFDEDEDLSVQNSLDQADTSIKEATKLAGQYMEIELMKYDLRISATLEDRVELAKMITYTSVADYREILLPLAKLYILEKLEKCLDREATDSSKVAKEAKLAPVSPEIKKSVNEGSNQPKPQSMKGRFDKEETESSNDAKEAKLAQISPEIKKSVNEGSNPPKSQSKKGSFDKEETVAKEAKLPQVSPEIKRSVNEGSNQSKPESGKGHFDEEETNSSEVVKEAKLAQVSPAIKKCANEGSNQSKPQSTDSKRSGGNAQLSLDQQSGEQIPDQSASSSADHPDSKSICKSGDNDLEKNTEFQSKYENQHKQKAGICKKEKEKVGHQKEMEALKHQELLENQRQHTPLGIPNIMPLYVHPRHRMLSGHPSDGIVGHGFPGSSDMRPLYPYSGRPVKPIIKEDTISFSTLLKVLPLVSLFLETILGNPSLQELLIRIALFFIALSSAYLLKRTMKQQKSTLCTFLDVGVCSWDVVFNSVALVCTVSARHLWPSLENFQTLLLCAVIAFNLLHFLWKKITDRDHESLPLFRSRI